MGRQKKKLKNCVLCTLIMCDTCFVNYSFLETEALTLEILTFLPRSVLFSLFLSFFLVGRAPSCPVGVGLSLLLPVFFFFWRWKLTKASETLQASFSPTADRFHVATFTMVHTHPPTHTHARKLSHTLSCQQSLNSLWLSHTQGTALLEAAQDPSLNLPQWSVLL